MITKMTGKLVSLNIDCATLEIGAFEYEVLIPEFTRRHLQSEVRKNVSLHTIEYIEGNQMQSRSTPRLVGFLTEAEREFFELFCSVDGVGVKKALRAMIRPVREVAAAIEEKDEKWLSSLPGVGAATAERIVAKLRRKVPKFALMVARDVSPVNDTQLDVVSETFEALVSLGHSEAEARRLIDTALEGKKKFKDTTELLQTIYQQVGRR
ncbi:MAG: helix-hairpin-helix domain-containing protein [Planctomycetaceae bacterium]|nr:helix-hairpin-helix domain-containing protein [Planctomycetaceae bacterium]